MLTGLVLVSCGERPHQKKASQQKEATVETVETVETEKVVEEDIDWDELIEVPREWNPEVDAIFGPRKSWKAACEKAFTPEPTERRFVQGYFKGANHYLAVHDFIELWYTEYGNKYKGDDFVYWRLNQFEKIEGGEVTPGERVRRLRQAINDILDYVAGTQWDLNLQAALRDDFADFYCKRLLKEIPASSAMRSALGKENEAWNNYQKSIGSAYRLLEGDPSGNNGSSWSMAVCGFSEDNLGMRASSLEDLLDIIEGTFAPGKKDVQVGREMVTGEAEAFSKGLKEDDYSYPLAKRVQALELDIRDWGRWMDARSAIRSLLPEEQRELFDASTETILRHKYIMLKNRYEGYGLTSDSVLELLIPYDCDTETLLGPSFQDKKEQLISAVAVAIMGIPPSGPKRCCGCISL